MHQWCVKISFNLNMNFHCSKSNKISINRANHCHSYSNWNNMKNRRFSFNFILWNDLIYIFPVFPLYILDVGLSKIQCNIHDSWLFPDSIDLIPRGKEPKNNFRNRASITSILSLMKHTFLIQRVTYRWKADRNIEHP